MPQSSLSVEDVCKSYRSAARAEHLQVLRDVRFTVRAGEIVSIVGESGCGKTTLLRIVQGLVAADRGVVAVGGRQVSGPGSDRTTVFQQANLLPWRTARKNVEFGLEVQGRDKAARVARARELLRLVGLENFENHYPHQLSGGMQQRIGLARALATNPDVLLMDEPFSALDAQTREVLQAELLGVLERTGKTIVFVTHDLDEAIYLSDRVVVMAARPGRVREIITVPFARPRPSLPELRAEQEFQQLRQHTWSLITSPREDPA
ncbi:ABC transporter ATP-binding protein [Amycolatopsis acidicola]|uniref:ABC transporter ATP-binding protein n=1 Tax=Amycolatopsis acidicola TaxID=2596893 RepID=A0A5N0V2K7_9PSEU|nr:ABC transporter ATP-binding protein [Amycolatopsis acidicola]KAA9160054.1 ABC transporter ATP-binding protein [Amycolatopsis acidicola]